MPKDPKQSAKLLFMKDCFERCRDNNDGISLHEIRNYLERKGVSVSKDETITEGIQTLSQEGYGMRIEHLPYSKQYLYHPDYDSQLTSAELQFLVDCVQSSKFLSEKATEHIIDKLLLLCSETEEKAIKDTTSSSRPTKNNNADVMYNLEILQQGIAQNRQVAFAYGTHNMHKQLVRKFAEDQIESPLQLIYCDDNYYLMVWNESEGNVKPYRIDRILGKVKLLNDAREQTRKFDDIDKKYYTQQSFHMFSGNQCKVTMLCANYIMNTVIDQFGHSVDVTIVDEKHFSISPMVCISPQFYGWVLGLNGAVRITEPKNIVEEIKKYIIDAQKMYE